LAFKKSASAIIAKWFRNTATFKSLSQIAISHHQRCQLLALTANASIALATHATVRRLRRWQLLMNWQRYSNA
jgi:hypothetical protein